MMSFSFPTRLKSLEEEALPWDDESLELDLATAMSLSETRNKRQTVGEDSSEEEDSQVFLAGSYEDNDEEVQVALAVSKTLQEEENLKKALAVSQASYEELREIELVDLLQHTSETERQQEEGVSMIEIQEQFLEWSEFSVELVDPDLVDSIPLGILVDNCEEEPVLPSMYKNYRMVPTLFSDCEMWSSSAVRQQLRELRVNRGSEDVKEWQETQCENERCLVCFTNVATRVAVPCGHKLCCRPCFASVVDKPNYYSVTSVDGDILTTDIQLPVQCFTCRSIVGQIIIVH